MPRPVTVEEHFAREIASLRASGYSPTEIARECRISRQTLWRIEIGDCRRLSFDVGQKVENGIARLKGE
ncbi:helix-turn-helix domain-containing protein [Sinorhizobium medicae]|nr:helix-turn-helix domain-containing protein [Sinorhizobium medicae]